MIKKLFYFMLKALFVLEIFSFFFCFFGYVKKRLDKRALVIKRAINFNISKLLTSQTGKQIITIHI